MAPSRVPGQTPAASIQIADLNALNAALAVIVLQRKLFGFYVALDAEYHCSYTIDGNALSNDNRCP